MPRPRLRPLLLALLAAGLAPAANAAIPLGEVAGAKLSFEGLIQADGNWYDNDVADLGGNAESALRRAELALKGKGPGTLEWAAGYDAKAEKWLDVNLKAKPADGHALQIGQFKQPNSMEELGSTKHNDFVSKAAVANTWAVSRRLGASYAISGSGWGVTASVFSRELTRGGGEGPGVGLRGTWAPLNAGAQTLHLGLSYASYQAELATADNAQRWRARPQADLAAVRLVDTGVLTDADKVRTLGLEVALLQGPIKLQGEWMRNTTTRNASLPDFNGSGAYASAVWNVTGETWGYKNGLPGTPSPAGNGLLQLGLRYDTLDLDDGRIATTLPASISGILGGQMDAWTVGANYYWQSNLKLALNYVKVQTEKYRASRAAKIQDNPSIVELRAQLHW